LLVCWHAASVARLTSQQLSTRLRDVVNSTQLSIPSPVAPGEIERKQTLGAAITLCYDAAGLVPKQVADRCQFDKAQLSRWESGTEGITWPRLAALMDVAGNDVPMLWMLHQRGYDLASVRRRESELEHQLRLMTEERDALKRVLVGGR
jgi:transcriptional regulator with XRE-family HTH domain